MISGIDPRGRPCAPVAVDRVWWRLHNRAPPGVAVDPPWRRRLVANPCIACGACCACYRVAFYWAEAEPALGGRVPAPMTVKLDPHRVAMAGTVAHPARCTALEGIVGGNVRCTIYADRPSPCRELKSSWIDGAVSEQCDRARRTHGLPPLTADDWVDPLAPRGPPRCRAG